MCTLVICWDPGSSKPLTVGANRDENPARSSKGWALRDRNIYCPKDVRGGTWIGVNVHGMFAALTNLHCERPSRGRNSRGHLVTAALSALKVDYAITKVIRMMNDRTYNAFNLIMADSRRMVVISGMGSSGDIAVKNLGPGWHIANNWGIDNWELPKCLLVQEKLNKLSMREILSEHGDGTPRGAVCVHDAKDHATVSSSIIEVKGLWERIVVDHVSTSPCLVKEHWDRFEMELSHGNLDYGRNGVDTCES